MSRARRATLVSVIPCQHPRRRTGPEANCNMPTSLPCTAGKRLRTAISSRGSGQKEHGWAKSQEDSATRLGLSLCTHIPMAPLTSLQSRLDQAGYGARKYHRRPKAWKAPNEGTRSSGNHLGHSLSKPGPKFLTDPVPIPKSLRKITTFYLSEHSGKIMPALPLTTSGCPEFQHLARGGAQ